MKKMIMLTCLVFVFSGSVFAGAQQEKMKGCSKEAKGMKGDERKTFMKKCLSKDYTLKADTAAPAAADEKPVVTDKKPVLVDKKPVVADKKPDTRSIADAAATQQDKMKFCNADAKTRSLQGDERKKFISACLKS